MNVFTIILHQISPNFFAVEPVGIKIFDTAGTSSPGTSDIAGPSMTYPHHEAESPPNTTCKGPQ